MTAHKMTPYPARIGCHFRFVLGVVCFVGVCVLNVFVVRLVLKFLVWCWKYFRLCFVFLVSNVSCRLLKHNVAGLKALVTVPTATVAVRSCTSWKNASPHNREFEKKGLPHDRELQ